MSRRTQDFLFTLYGDYLSSRGGEAWVGSLIELLSCLEFSAQAVRSTVSRMSQKGWLQARRVGRNSYYSLTPKSHALLEEGSQRIFHPQKDSWDGRWHILVYSIPEEKRHLRDRLRQHLVWLGFGLLNQATWISPRDVDRQVKAILDKLGIQACVEIFQAEHVGYSSAHELVAHCWNLEALNRSYAEFIERHESSYESLLKYPEWRTPCNDFTRRFMLVHEYRMFPYVDPNLPIELLPTSWLGDKAIALFRNYYALLTDTAETFVSTVLDKTPASDKSPK